MYRVIQYIETGERLVRQEEFSTWSAAARWISDNEDDYPESFFGIEYVEGDPAPKEEYDDADPGEMDGDHASALASVGWGTDEDYGYQGDEY